MCEGIRSHTSWIYRLSGLCGVVVHIVECADLASEFYLSGEHGRAGILVFEKEVAGVFCKVYMAGAGGGASSGQGSNLCLVVHSAGNAALMQRPIPSPGPNQVLIRVEAVRVQSVCVKLAEGSLLSPSGKPIVPGQEFCGVVVGCGVNVDKSLLDIGHRVAVTPMSFCQRCYFCERGQTNLCESGAELFGWNVDGGYQQYVCVNQKLCHSFDKAVPWRQAVLASTAAAASYGMTKASILPGDSVLIIGTNVVGLMGVVFARGLGAEYICVVGRAGASPDQAMTCGASKFLTWDACGDESQQFQQVRQASHPFSDLVDPQDDSLLLCQHVGRKY